MKHTVSYREGYPRPQFVRNEWTDLNGEWDFAFDDADRGEREKWYRSFPKGKKILVPFAYQTPKSGIGDTAYHPTVWYATERTFSRKAGERILIQFEGVDSEAKVWCNGVYIGSHRGGYCRFSMDITSALRAGGRAFIVVRADDDLSCTKPRGKQGWLNEPFGCWYCPTTGIWKSVWAEKIAETSIARVKMTPKGENYHLFAEYEIENFRAGLTLRTVVSFGESVVADQSMKLSRANHTFSIDLSNDADSFKIHWWTPENPQLYDVVFYLSDENGKIVDTVYSYTAFRLFRTHKNKVMLNLNPIYLRMVLEQGYWRETGLTCPCESALEKEILLAKEFGFNGMRMHQKIEDERFYYYADVHGMLVFCELPSSYEFKEVSVERVAGEWLEAVRQNYNHPCVVAWVPTNESWGVNRLTYNAEEMHFTKALYELTKAYDGMRPVVSNDGWEHTTGDLITFHNYCQEPAELEEYLYGLSDLLEGKNRNDYTNLRLPFALDNAYQGQPVLLDEFAGIGFQVRNDDGWGYGDKVSSAQAFVERLSGLVNAVRKNHAICGFCITQLTDVYQEINGLCDFERKPKADVAAIRKAVLGK